jgi:uncharacterized protein
MSPEALRQLICCPETHQPLEVAAAALITQLNRQIAAGQLRNRGGHLAEGPLESGWLRADQRALYPVRQRIPALLIEEAIPLPRPDGSAASPLTKDH